MPSANKANAANKASQANQCPGGGKHKFTKPVPGGKQCEKCPAIKKIVPRPNS